MGASAVRLNTGSVAVNGIFSAWTVSQDVSHTVKIIEIAGLRSVWPSGGTPSSPLLLGLGFSTTTPGSLASNQRMMDERGIPTHTKTAMQAHSIIGNTLPSGYIRKQQLPQEGAGRVTWDFRRAPIEITKNQVLLFVNLSATSAALSIESMRWVE